MALSTSVGWYVQTWQSHGLDPHYRAVDPQGHWLQVHWHTTSESPVTLVPPVQLVPSVPGATIFIDNDTSRPLADLLSRAIGQHARGWDGLPYVVARALRNQADAAAPGQPRRWWER